MTATPPVKGEAARRIQHEIKHGTPDTPERLAFLRESDRIYETIKYQLRSQRD